VPSITEYMIDVASSAINRANASTALRPAQIDILMAATKQLEKALKVYTDEYPEYDEAGNPVFEPVPPFETRILRINNFGGHATDWAREMSLDFGIPIEKYQKVCAFLEDFAATKVLCQPEARPAVQAMRSAVSEAACAATPRDTCAASPEASERPSDWLDRLGNDAYKWGAEFAIMYGLISNKKDDEQAFDRRGTHDIMIGWFANAMAAQERVSYQKYEMKLEDAQQESTDTIHRLHERIEALLGEIADMKTTNRCLAANIKPLEERIADLKHRLEHSGYSQGHQQGYAKGHQAGKDEVLASLTMIKDEGTKDLEARITDLKKQRDEAFAKGRKAGYAAGVRYHEGFIKDVLLAGGVLGEGASIIIQQPSASVEFEVKRADGQPFTEEDRMRLAKTNRLGGKPEDWAGDASYRA
jgi:hypothetical protein